MRNLRVSLKQWRMLHAVIDCGGFSDAARHLHLSQSAISYTIAKLQDQLGVPLLKIEGRKARITEAGRMLLDRSRHLIRDAIELEQFAENLQHGAETELRLVVDQEFPNQLLMHALRKFSGPRSSLRVTLSEVTMAQAERALCERTADLAICAQVPTGFLGDPLIDLEYVAVAHPDHPLFALERTVTTDDLERRVQIVISRNKDGDGRRQAERPKATQCWNVSSVDTAMLALKECLGYAWLSRHLVQHCIDSGELKLLPLGEGCGYRKTFYLIHGKSPLHSPAARQLADVLRELRNADGLRSIPY
jgi:DNA-binding transcriptional LysR family regulator